MSRFLILAPALVAGLAVAACADRDLPTAPLAPIDAPAPQTLATSPRERLAQRLAVTLADPAARADVLRRLQASRAPEGKVQFQALARLEGGALLARLAAQSGTSTADLLADMAAAKGLELYLPVEAHRAMWTGDEAILVGTIERDGDTPIAFTTSGERRILDPNRPPTTPVLALVPQELDFTGGQPARAATCWTLCDDIGSGGGGLVMPGSTPGLYMTTSHFDDDYESWIKGKPEYEYHVYGQKGSGDTEQLACTGEHAGGPYAWDQNELDWSGEALLLSAADHAAYQARVPNGVVRILALEDDDQACVLRGDTGRFGELVKAVDAAYKALTSGKVEPWYVKGIKVAPSSFSLLKAIYSFITTGDDFIGNAVETSVAGAAPGGANWLLKTEGTRTTGWFATAYRH
jgi:hypothetical protein